MIVLDRNMLNISSNEFYTNNHIDRHNKKTIWIYNNYIASRNKYTATPEIINMCIETVTRHLGSDYNILVFTQADIGRIVPEYTAQINNCKSEYIRENLLKYSIIYKYGGVWLNCSTLVLNKFDIDEQPYLQGKLIFFAERILEYNDNFNVFDFTNIAAIKNSRQVQKILTNLLKVSNTLNYDYSFNKLIESTLNDDADIHYMPISNIPAFSNIQLNNKTLFTYSSKFDIPGSIKLIYLNFTTLLQEPSYNNILTMTRRDILENDSLLKSLIKYSLD